MRYIFFLSRVESVYVWCDNTPHPVPPTRNWALPILIVMLCMFSSKAFANTCEGRFVNPLTDICWECAFPITIGATPIVASGTPDTPNPTSPICQCGDPLPRVGIWHRRHWRVISADGL